VPQSIAPPSFPFASLLALSLLLAPAPAQGAAIPFGAACPPGALSAFGFAPNPGAGRIALYEAGVLPGSLPLVAFGLSDAAWGSVPLPFDLASVGLPGCRLLVDPAASHVAGTPSPGTAEAFIAVPPDPLLAGARLFGQWANLLDPRAGGALPVTVSDGVAFTLGPSVGMPGFVLTGDPTAANGANWTYAATVGGVAYDLQGRLYKPSSPPAGGHALYPAVVISHGFGGSATGYSSNVARTMVGWGLVCIMTNLTHAGAGVPVGAPGTASERGASAANVLRNRKCVDLLQSLGYVDMRRLAAHGHSMGAFATGALLGSHPDTFLVGSHTAGGMSTQPGAAATTLAQAQSIRAPYQLHHGDADTVVPLALDQLLAAELQRNPTVHELRVYAGVTHAQIAADPGVLAAVRAWYTAHGLLP
jgi:dienelactone hydrolase